MIRSFLLWAVALLAAAPATAQTPQAGTYLNGANARQEATGTFCVPAKDGSGCILTAASGDRVLRSTAIGATATYSAYVANFTPAATPTDIASLALNGEHGRVVLVRRITIRAIADTAGLADIFVNFRGGTNQSTFLPTMSSDSQAPGAAAYLGTFASNPPATTIGTIAQSKLQIGTLAAPAPELVFEWGTNDRPPALRGLTGTYNRQVSVSLGGATLPANVKLDVNVRWVEEPVRVIILAGDSLFGATSNLLPSLAQAPGVLGTVDVRNYGNTGKQLIDLLPTAAQNTGGLNYDFNAIMNTIPAYGSSTVPTDVVEAYLTNDVRQGATSLPQAISLLDAFLYVMKNGTISGQSWTSTKAGGAGTTFTWNATVPARPQARVWLFGPNSYLADDPTGAGYIATTGVFAGMTLAQASQAATDIVYNAYAAFVGDPRVYSVAQRQDYVSPTTGYAFGRTVRTGANNPLLANTLHSNTTLGEPLEAEQLISWLGLR